MPAFPITSDHFVTSDLILVRKSSTEEPCDSIPCRMSENPRDGVCNKFGQAHDVRNLRIFEGSQFKLAAPKIQL